MPLGPILIAKGLLDPIQLEEARQHQKTAGGSLAASLLTLELISSEELGAFLAQEPLEAGSVEATGLDRQFLLDFLLKAIYMTGCGTSDALSDVTKLSQSVINTVLEDAKSKRLVEVLGLADPRGCVYQYALSGDGRRWALDALTRCQYTGPAPVPIARWQEQVVKQSITRDHVTPETMTRAMAHLVLPGNMVSRLGPAANSGRAILLYGGVGNGKTSIAEAIGDAFLAEIWVPHCVEIAGQIIKVFDAALHHPIENSSKIDARWVRCRRPVVVTGGELTLEMLDLSFDEVSKTYEAPAHIKATGGVFIIDDFGRQRVRPQDLLNRWIFPLERRVDFLTLHTGKKIELVFDQLVIFSTNFAPKELIDEAGLRRIPYKFHVAPPDQKIYTEILRRLCVARHVELPGHVISYLMDHFYPRTGQPLSAAHPAFIVEHVIERCCFDRREAQMDPELVFEAAQHLVVDSEAPAPILEEACGPLL
jgi:hypothetical protein